MNNRRAPLLFVGLVVLLASALGGLTYANYRFAQANPGGNDFLARWTGAHYWLVEGISPYDERVSLAAQEMIYGRRAQPRAGEDVAHFVCPLPSMLFFGLFGLIEFLPARGALWMTVLEVSLIALTLVSLRLVEWRVSPIGAALMVLFGVVWYHGARDDSRRPVCGCCKCTVDRGGLTAGPPQPGYGSGPLAGAHHREAADEFSDYSSVLIWGLINRTPVGFSVGSLAGLSVLWRSPSC